MSQTAREAESKEEKKLKAVVKPIDMAKGFSEAKALFKDFFSAPPWSDDWSDEAKLNAYIDDIAGQRNSCPLGLCAEEDGKAKLVGLSFGRLIHFYEGTQYRVDEFCIRPAFQGKGYGSLFIKEIGRILKEMCISYILLDTVKTYKAYSSYLKNGFKEIKDDVGLSLKLG